MKKRKDGRYCKELTINGKRHSFYGATQNEVFAKIREFEEKQEVGRSFEEVADEFREECENRLAPGSLKTYIPSIKRAQGYFKDTPIRAITPPMVNAYIMDFCKQSPSRKTANHQLMVVSLIFKNAVIRGDIESNPAQYVKIPNGLKKEIRGLPLDSEIEIVKNSLDQPFGLFPYFILYTGLRRGEALALTYEDIDFSNEVIKVSKSLSYKGATPYLKEPKTESGKRSIPLLNPLKKVLDPNRKGLVFASSKGDLMPSAQYERRWRAYQKKTGITCTAHQLRHAYATIIFEAGISAKDAQDLLGHSDISMTNNIYTHIRETKRKDTAKKLNDFLK